MYLQSDRQGLTPEEQPKTLVLLCQTLDGLANGLDVASVSEWLRETDPAVQVEIIDDVCRRPAAISRTSAAQAKRLVLGLCSADYSELEIQSQARKVGLDPLSVEIVNLGAYCALTHPRPLATDRAKLLLAAAVARARAFPGSGPENVKPILLRQHQKVSRRALFTLPPISYRAVASVEAERCASEEGCRQCIEVCPRGALTASDGRVTVDKSACLACGVCLLECPRSAIRLPTHSPPQLKAEMAELLLNPVLDTSQPRALLFVCERNTPALESLGREGFTYPAGWLPVRVPCVGMVPTGWLLQCFALGAAAVGAVTCDGACPFGQRERIEGRLDFCRDLLGLLRGSPGDVRLLKPTSGAEMAETLNQPLEGGAPHRDGHHRDAPRSGPLSAVMALHRLAQEYDAPSTLSLSHAHSPLGAVQIDRDGCTGCGACATTCPTAALALRSEDGRVAITFDPALCTGCAQCDRWCPEQAILIDRVTDLQLLSGGKVTLFEEREVRCEACGNVIGPAAMLRRIEALLYPNGDANSSIMAAITRRCPSCRAIGGRPAGPLEAGRTT